jgi:hypothetical protein
MRRESSPAQGAEERAKVALEVIFDLAESAREADATLAEYAEREPKVRELLTVPQSADKHAEGPTILDHYRTILMGASLIERGRLEARHLQSFADLGAYETDWDEVTQFIRAHTNLMRAFNVSHDLGKVDFFGVYATTEVGRKAGFLDRKSFHATQKTWGPEDRRAWREKYVILYNDFAAKHSGMDPAETQRRFFDTYGLSVTYFKHELGGTIPENKAVIDRLQGELGLTPADRKLLDFGIRQHISDFLPCTRGPSDYDALRKLAEQEDGLNVDLAMMFLVAGMMTDGVLGARKNDTEGRWYIRVESLRSFFAAERAYLAYLADREAEARRKEHDRVLRGVLKASGLGGHDLIALGFVQDRRFARLVAALHEALDRGSQMDVHSFFPDTADETCDAVALRFDAARVKLLAEDPTSQA